MNHEIIKKMAELFEKFDLPADEVAKIFRECSNLMGETLVVSEDKNKNKLKSRFEIEQKYEELNQRMSKVSPMDMFGTASTDGKRYILEWVLGLHDEDKPLQEILNLK